MTIRKTALSLHEYYHIYSRGVDKRDIFLSDKDKKRFTKMLYVCNGNKPVIYKTIQDLPLNKIEIGDKNTSIGAYCLMDNHFHLLVKETQENGIVKFMSKLLTGYSMYFNKKYERTGRLFESNFKSIHINNDEYLKYIFSYIHLNPAKKIYKNWRTGISKNEQERLYSFVSNYEFSSLSDYLATNRENSLIINKEYFPKYFQTVNDYKRELWEWISFPDLVQEELIQG